MTHRPDHLIDATWEDGDPGQDASQYGRPDWIGTARAVGGYALAALAGFGAAVLMGVL